MTANAAEAFRDLPAWVEQHLHEAVAATLRKRAERADQRAEAARQRADATATSDTGSTS